jgi:hypothetical protein
MHAIAMTPPKNSSKSKTNTHDWKDRVEISKNPKEEVTDF